MLPADVACVEVNEQTFGEFTIGHPSPRANGLVAEVEHPVFGKHYRHGPIVSLSPSNELLPGCRAGEHTRAVLQELGYSNDEVDDLARQGIVAWPDDKPQGVHAARAAST